MFSDSGAILRDGIVLAYMFLLRIGVPVLVIALTGKWIQRRMAESDLREQQMRMGEPYCWDIRRNAQTRSAKRAAAAHPELPCWLAVQTQGGGVTESCFDCSRYAVNATHLKGHLAGDTVEVGSYEQDHNDYTS